MLRTFACTEKNLTLNLLKLTVCIVDAVLKYDFNLLSVIKHYMCIFKSHFVKLKFIYAMCMNCLKIF